MTVFNEPQKIVFPATTAVKNGNLIVITQELLPGFLWATGLSSTDSIPIKVTPDKGVTKEPFFQDGSAVVLTPTNKGEAIKAPMTLVIDKPTTAAAVAIYFNSGLHC